MPNRVRRPSHGIISSRYATMLGQLSRIEPLSVPHITIISSDAFLLASIPQLLSRHHCVKIIHFAVLATAFPTRHLEHARLLHRRDLSAQIQVYSA